MLLALGFWQIRAGFELEMGAGLLFPVVGWLLVGDEGGSSRKEFSLAVGLGGGSASTDLGWVR